MLKLNADRIVSLSAIFVSVGTLFIIIYQTNLIRKSQKATVMPYLTISMSQSDMQQRIFVTNSGLGPALIKSVRILENEDEIFPGGPSEFAVHNLADSFRLVNSFYRDIILPGRLIPADNGLRTFSHSTEGKYGNYIASTFKFPYNQKGKFIIEISYESVYGDAWVVRSHQTVPQEIK